MLLGGLQKMTLVDYPGRVAATVFTSGCNFSCPFCHNPELVNIGSSRHHLFLPEEEFFAFLESRGGMIEGVCITGGEPTIHTDLKEFTKKIKALGFFVKLDTNGARPDVLADMTKEKLVDYVAMDIKGPLDKYLNIINAQTDLEKIHESTQIIRSLPEYEFRTTVVPTLHQKDDFLNIARWLDGSKRYFLQQFKPDNTLDSAFNEIRPYPDEKLVEFSELIRPYFGECGVRI